MVGSMAEGNGDRIDGVRGARKVRTGVNEGENSTEGVGRTRWKGGDVLGRSPGDVVWERMISSRW